MTDKRDVLYVPALVGHSLQGLIHGPLPTKSNSRRLVRRGGRIVSIKSQEALDWTERFTAAASEIRSTEGFRPLHGKLYLTVDVYPDSMRRDLDVELLCDALQRAGLIRNDRDLWDKHAVRKPVDKANPRVWFEVGVIGGVHLATDPNLR
jgi:Holliday junction resolvase RusA-like endonuclease